ncbi:MAG: hypothetical protein MJY72_08180 [Bacteroidales bacterium]|nr:hypothetical protein [Bacteroidales bacterium]
MKYLKNKRGLVIILLIHVALNNACAQSPIQYSYDSAGNRTVRSRRMGMEEIGQSSPFTQTDQVDTLGALLNKLDFNQVGYSVELNRKDFEMSFSKLDIWFCRRLEGIIITEQEKNKNNEDVQDV